VHNNDPTDINMIKKEERPSICILTIPIGKAIKTSKDTLFPVIRMIMHDMIRLTHPAPAIIDKTGALSRSEKNNEMIPPDMTNDNPAKNNKIIFSLSLIPVRIHL
jgi:hypothetical protein